MKGRTKTLAPSAEKDSGKRVEDGKNGRGFLSQACRVDRYEDYGPFPHAARYERAGPLSGDRPV